MLYVPLELSQWCLHECEGVIGMPYGYEQGFIISYIYRETCPAKAPENLYVLVLARNAIVYHTSTINYSVLTVFHSILF